MSQSLGPVPPASAPPMRSRTLASRCWYWKRATAQGALAGIVTGLATWIPLEFFGSADSVWPPQLVGFLAAGAAMVVGSLAPQRYGKPGTTDTAAA